MKYFNRKRNSDIDSLKKNQLALEVVNHEETTISVIFCIIYISTKINKKECSSTDSNPNEDEKKKQKILYFNENLEDLGYFRYLASPFVKIYTLTKNTMGCCKRKEANPNSEDERGEDDEDIDSQEENNF